MSVAKRLIEEELERAAAEAGDAPDLADLADDIRNARDLDALCAAVNRFWAEAGRAKAGSDAAILDPSPEHYGVSMAGLPTFGGEEPRNTACVWSWDAERVMVGDAAPFTVEPRDPEAWYARSPA